MPKRMLIDASHPEETRVIVLDGQKVEEFDFEAASKRPLKGNIYLAKVTRVEPSLQAAFVEYGGNRQGFLAFSEIHPDYYQIPVADRMALIAEQEAEARRRSEEEFESVETATVPAQKQSISDVVHSDSDHSNGPNDTEPFGMEESASASTADQPAEDAGENHAVERQDDSAELDTETGSRSETQPDLESPTENLQPPSQAKPLQAARPPQRWMRRRHYKIQEVIKRRQIILVQVVKEERGTKGAALTTYLSLAGRYCVLMPNTPRGGGISRKITSATDRKRLKTAAQSLELPEGMGLIIRTAGENRTKTEIKRDYEYLLRMWDTVRELTLQSNAPACVYEEGDLIKRAIRDLYNKDVSEIVVEGEDGYRNAKEFMRMLMPSHAKNVKFYKEPVPLFQRHHIEAQLDAMFSSTVTLRSGGYVVINQTEALVAIDVNSGRATREHSIEDTAYKTNLEAAEEISRQLRLRDLAGLIVIDFIDMEDIRNDRNVEKRLRDCVKNDRARVQIGKISQFGLLEMSRQRLRAGVVAGSTVTCPHCGGQGIVRSVESTALRLLRSIEEEGQRQRAESIVVRAQPDVTIYTLNQKRRELARIESEYGLSVQFEPKDGIIAGTFELDRIAQKPAEQRIKTPQQPSPDISDVSTTPDREDEPLAQDEAHAAEPASHPTLQSGTPEAKRKRRRRRRGRDHPSSGGSPVIGEPVPSSALGSSMYAEGDSESPDAESEPLPGSSTMSPHGSRPSPQPNAPQENGPPKRKRRRRRRGRRGGQLGQETVQPSQSGEEAPRAAVDYAGRDESNRPQLPVHEMAEDSPTVVPNAPSEPVWSLAQPKYETRLEPAPEPVSRHRSDEHENIPANDPSPYRVPEEPAAASEPPRSPRKGWWQRPFRSRE